MTTIDQTTKPDSVDPAAAAGATPLADGAAVALPSASTDPDDIALAEAHAAAQAEETAAKAAGTDPAGATGAPPTPQPEAPVGARATPVVPKGRLDEALSRAQKAEMNAAYLQGIVDARAAPALPGAPAQPQQTAEQRIAEIDHAGDALAAKFDAGEITMAEYRSQERTLNRQADAVREEARPKAQPAAPAQPAANDELYLETLTTALETEHPWVAVADKVGKEADWAYVKSLAVENLKDRGINWQQQGSLGKYELRKEVSKVWTEIGPGLLTARATASGIELPGPSSSQPSPQPQPKPLSADALARQAKLGLHNGAPPSLASMSGATSPIAGEPSEAQLSTMTDDDYDKLPAAVRNKLKGISP